MDSSEKLEASTPCYATMSVERPPSPPWGGSDGSPREGFVLVVPGRLDERRPALQAANV